MLISRSLFRLHTPIILLLFAGMTLSASQATPVYNQAYTENFDGDSIADILANARNAYVLIDPFPTGIAAHISAIQAKNNEVGAYISIGTGEDWRADYAAMQPYLVTKQWAQWAGEYFVNKTNTGILPIMKARIDQIAIWGADWVEFDNMDWVFDDDYRSTYGIAATEAEGISYYQALCDHVHLKGMKCMAKNMVESAGNFDGVLYESYDNEKNWWDVPAAQAFSNTGKLFIINHYNEANCDQVYSEYNSIYSNLSFICEDSNLKKYKHYQETGALALPAIYNIVL